MAKDKGGFKVKGVSGGMKEDTMKTKKATMKKGKVGKK